MTSTGKSRPAADVAGDGRLPITIRIGVTGHRVLTDVPGLRRAAGQAVDELIEGLLGAGARPELRVISALAEGADRLLAEEILARPGSALEAVLPMPPTDYLADFSGPASQAEFLSLLGRARCRSFFVPADADKEAGYERAGRQIVDSCDVLIAVWDGAPARGPGGTAAVVRYAEHEDVPRVCLPASGDHAPVYFLTGKGGAAIRAAARAARIYNRARIRHFEPKVRAALAALKPGSAAPGGPPSQFERDCERLAAWITPYRVRADRLASRVEHVFHSFSVAIFVLAALAVTVAAIDAIRGDACLTWAEVGMLAAVIVIAAISWRSRFLERWISRRYLAERLRSWYFLALVNERPADEPPHLPGHHVDPAAAWIASGLREVDARRPAVQVGQADLAAARYLRTRWIESQVSYHHRRARRQARCDRCLHYATVAFFAATLACAIIVRSLAAHPHEWTSWLEIAAISLPALGAAAHGIKAQAQFRHQGRRSETMARDLRQAHRLLEDENSLDSITIRKVAASADLITLEESGDWFGLVRLHDVELIV